MVQRRQQLARHIPFIVVLTLVVAVDSPPAHDPAANPPTTRYTVSPRSSLQLRLSLGRVSSLRSLAATCTYLYDLAVGNLNCDTVRNSQRGTTEMTA